MFKPNLFILIFIFLSIIYQQQCLANDYHIIENVKSYLDDYTKSLNFLLENSVNHNNNNDHKLNDIDFNHNCIHDKIKHKHHNHKSNNNNEHHDIKELRNRDLMSTNVMPEITTHPIRIQFNTTFLNGMYERQTCRYVGQKVKISFSNTQVTCTPKDILTNELISLITNVILPYIGSTYEKLLTVTAPVYQPASMFRQVTTCGHEGFPVDVSAGFNADYMMYVTAHPIGVQSVNAYASACLLDSNNKNRPYVGFINFNPEVFSVFANSQYKSQHQTQWQQYLRAGLHECTHALGFSDELFQHYIDRNTGRPYNYNINPIINVRGSSPSGSQYKIQRSYLATPNVLQIARDHFDCQDLPGAELENNGGSGTKNSHWKATTFGEELMIGYGQPVAPLTNLTLALLYDSGWYGLINLHRAEPLIWGKSKGCSFAQDGCGPSTWNYPGYWAYGVSNNQRGCTPTRSAIGLTSWGQLTQNLPPNQQHWREKNVGCVRGEIFDYCLLSSVYDNIASTYYCFDTNNKPTVDGEVFGQGSACFHHLEGQSSRDKLIPACRPQRCVGEQLEVQIDGVWYACSPGDRVKVGTTTIFCPDETDQHCISLKFAVKPSNTSSTKVPSDDGLLPISIDTDIHFDKSPPNLNHLLLSPTSAAQPLISFKLLPIAVLLILLWIIY